MFSTNSDYERLQVIEALCTLGEALDEPHNPNRDIYIQAALFAGAVILIKLPESMPQVAGKV